VQRLYRAADLTDAYLLLHRLQREGIGARVLNEHARGALGEIPFTHAAPEVWLDDERDLGRAQALLRQHEAAPVSGRSWRCPRCREDNPAEFELCWNCGAAARET
jgi:hypothetical protein